MTLDELKAGGATLVVHINYGDGYGYVYKCALEPRLSIHVQGPKTRKSKRQRSTNYRVAGDDRDFTTLEEAWLELQKRDQREKQDADWTAAAPKRIKPAAIPGMDTDPA